MATNGLRDAGWNWISFDDVGSFFNVRIHASSHIMCFFAATQCWEADTRDNKGNLQADPTRFPDGMASMVNFIHAQNFSVQIYTSLGFSTCSRSGRPLPLPGSYGHEVQVQKKYWHPSLLCSIA
jgi:hypothetical protein